MTAFTSRPARRVLSVLLTAMLESGHSMFGSDSLSASPQTWLLQILDKVFWEAGFFPEDRKQHTEQLTRETSSAWACDVGHEWCTKYGNKDFPKWLNDSNR